MENSRDSLVVSEDTIRATCGEPDLPPLGVIEQIWDTTPIPRSEIPDQAAAAVKCLDWSAIPEGGEVAIGAGSRGIANLGLIVQGVVTGVRELGFEPFVFPAMGSHGGATAEGQRDKLESLGADPDTIGCDIRSSMDVIQLRDTPDRGVPVYFDAIAAEADAILPVNRVKPHTDFDGTVESGLSKMLVIGMGKQRGAKTAHDWSVDWSLRNMLPEITHQLLEDLPVVGGVAIVEDQRDDTAIIEGVRPTEFLDREAELLEQAIGLMPKLPFDELDVLVIDQLGKDISGQGMDTNVTGRRHFTINEPEPETPDIKRIYARGLTETTKGNAMGMGAADFIHQDLLSAIDAPKSVINAITASTIRGVRIPAAVATDWAGLVASLSTIGVVAPSDVRVLRVTDTMRLERCYASPVLVDAARQRNDLRVIEEPAPIEFRDGQFVAPSPPAITH